MTHPKLVLLSDSETVANHVGEAEHLVIVRQSGKTLRAGGASTSIPAKRFLLRQNMKSPLDEWMSAISWLRELGGETALVVVDYDHPLRELLLMAQALDLLSFGLYLTTPVERVSVPEYALLGTAKCIVYEQDEHIDSLKKAYIGPFEAIPADKNIVPACINANAQKSTGLKPAPQSAIITSANAKKRVLVVSYFSGPCRTVGVQRINYWTEEIARLSDYEVEVHLATAIDWSSDDAHVHYVPDLYIAELLGENAEFLKWAYAFFESESFDAKHFNTLTFYWRYALEKYFERLDTKFDVVIFSGNPFAVFDFAAFAKRKWYSKIFLDYRDPFANNPRMKFPDAAREYAKFIEKGYNFQSDLCIAVNEMCLDYLEAKDDVNTLVIPNGYDERAFENITPQALEGDTIKFVHAGSFYYDRSPRALITSLDPARHSFHHIGSTAGIDEDILDAEGLVCHGRQPYPETLARLGGGDCGIVYVSETGFETPTKLYEYLAFGLDVLICTHGPIKEGALASVLKDHPNVFWCKNTEEGVQAFLKSYVPSKKSEADKERFTRRHSTQALIKAIMG